MSDQRRLLLLVLFGLAFPAALVFLHWLLFADSYNFTCYHMPGCNKTLTVMVISDSNRWRRVAFIPGRYHERRLPQHNYVLSHLDSGLGAGFSCIATCSGQQIVINKIGSFLETEPSVLIRSREVNGAEFQGLKESLTYPEVIEVE